MSHMLERGAGVYVLLGVGGTVVFAERRMERWAVNMAEVAPTIMVCVPRFFEHIERRIRADVTAAGPTARALVRLTRRLGRASYRRRAAGLPEPAWLRLSLGLARALVASGVRRATGGRLRFFVSGGAPLPARTGLLFDAMGMRIVEGYGLTETAPLLAVNRPESYRFGTVGWPVAATEVRIAEETGEVLVRGPQVMAGYLDRPNLTARVLDADGWFHTGDQGSIDPDGRLRITGLLKNLIVLSTGKKAAPAPIERAIGSSPFVRQAVLLGDGQEATGVLVVPDLEALATAAGREADEAAPGRPTGEASRLIATEVERLSAPFGAWERPRRFALLPRPLTAECGELRATGEPFRSAIAAAFPVEVASLFDGRPSLRVSDRHEARGEREDPGAALVAPRGGATSRGRVAG
jgi:long-chain acyl-CoA synthetase